MLTLTDKEKEWWSSAWDSLVRTNLGWPSSINDRCDEKIEAMREREAKGSSNHMNTGNPPPVPPRSLRFRCVGSGRGWKGYGAGSPSSPSAQPLGRR